MLNLPPALNDALASEVADLCWCWRLSRRDGLQLGFTQHDAALTLDGLVYQPVGTASLPDAETQAGLAPGSGTLHLAFQDEAISRDDAQQGLWNDARLDLLQTRWRNPIDFAHLQSWWFGEIRMSRRGCEVELVERQHKLEQVIGRVFSRACDASLGDARCGLSVDHPAYALGCDQAFATCRDRFQNTLNFRGFPYLVGNDVLLASPGSEPVRDGGSRGLG